MAKNIIAERHPLQDAPLYEVFSWLRPFRFFFPSYQRRIGAISEASRLSEERGEDEEEKQPLRQKTAFSKAIERARRAANAPEDPEEAKRKNAFFLFGFGIVAYLDLIYTFFWLFTLLSILLSPVSQFYQQHTGYAKAIGYEAMSLGNMGASSA